VTTAVAAGPYDGGGRSATTAPSRNAASNACPASAATRPSALATMPSATNCTTKSASVLDTDAPKQRNIAEASRCRRR
jgi:hypothetical protein